MYPPMHSLVETTHGLLTASDFCSFSKSVPGSFPNFISCSLRNFLSCAPGANCLSGSSRACRVQDTQATRTPPLENVSLTPTTTNNPIQVVAR